MKIIPMEQRPYWEPDSRSIGQKMTRLLENQNVCYRDQKGAWNPVYKFASYFFKIYRLAYKSLYQDRTHPRKLLLLLLPIQGLSPLTRSEAKRIVSISFLDAQCPVFQ
jgi:hypothetical protein